MSAPKPAEWPIEDTPEETIDPDEGYDDPDEVEEIIAKNAHIAQDGGSTQQVVHVAPDAANEEPQFRDTGVVTTGSQPQSHLDRE